MNRRPKTLTISFTINMEEDTMLLRLYSIGVIIFDILVLMTKCTCALLQSLYHVFVPPSEKSVVGEIVLITGTGHGIGRELALKYASLGAKVVCVDINSKGNQETVELIKERGYKKCFPYMCDVTKREDVNELIKQVQSDVGAVTVLINNAGIMPCQEFLNTTPEEFTRVFDINVMAHFWLLQAVLPNMMKNNHGHIVALSSMAGIIGFPNLVPYCGTKFAVRGIMEALAEELRMSGKYPNIHFTAIFPYIVDTGLVHKPKIRFASLMKPVTPKDAAAMITSAMRRNILFETLPPYYWFINNLIRVYPPQVGRYFKDFLDAGCLPHERKVTSTS